MNFLVTLPGLDKITRNGNIKFDEPLLSLLASALVQSLSPASVLITKVPLLLFVLFGSTVDFSRGEPDLER